MGLDATAFETATLLDPHEKSDDCWDEHEQAYIISPSFVRSLRGLDADRCYSTSGQQAEVSNSYVGHGQFRDELASLFLGVSCRKIWDSPDDYAEQPFFELIHFADNEGTIGPEAAADLLADFTVHRDLWRASVADEWLRRKYDEWTEVFRVAAIGGLVRFA